MNRFQVSLITYFAFERAIKELLIKSLGRKNTNEIVRASTYSKWLYK